MKRATVRHEELDPFSEVDEEKILRVDRGSPRRVPRSPPRLRAMCRLSVIIVFYLSILVVTWHRAIGGEFSCEREFDKASFKECWIATVSTASIYYRWQRHRIMGAAKNYSLHWSFSQTDVSGATSYESLVNRRFEAMVRNMERNPGRDDALVEKDKCLMYNFFERNLLPHVAPLAEWRSFGQLRADMVSGDAFQNVTAWPVFLKACHLTMGAASGVLMIKSRELEGNTWKYKAITPKERVRFNSMEDIMSWSEKKWHTKPVDTGRPWQSSADRLCSVLKPGFLLQPPAKLSYVEELDEKQIVEVKTYVLWGRAHLGMLVDAQCLFMRGPRDEDAEFSPVDGPGSILYLHNYLPSWVQTCLPHKSMQWIVKERHFACVWSLAERAARAMKIDEVRIDIFLSRGQPGQCTINEMSLSSGYGQGAFRGFWHGMWAEPHLEKAYKVWGDLSAKPVYMLDQRDA